jgi:hypothetical protein
MNIQDEKEETHSPYPDEQTRRITQPWIHAIQDRSGSSGCSSIDFRHVKNLPDTPL